MRGVVRTALVAVLVLVATGVVHVDLLVHHEGHHHQTSEDAPGRPSQPSAPHGEDAVHLHGCSFAHHVVSAGPVVMLPRTPDRQSGMAAAPTAALRSSGFHLSVFRPPRG